LFVVVVVRRRRSQSCVDCRDASNLKRENRTRMLLRRAVVAWLSVMCDGDLVGCSSMRFWDIAIATGYQDGGMGIHTLLSLQLSYRAASNRILG